MRDVALTEACDDTRRIEDLEKHLTVEREPASIVANRRVGFWFGGTAQGVQGVKFNVTPSGSTST